MLSMKNSMYVTSIPLRTNKKYILTTFKGASPAEQLIHAARDNNVALMQGIVDECKSEEEAADLLNNVKDRTGMYLYHIAAKHGVCRFLKSLHFIFPTPCPKKISKI